MTNLSERAKRLITGGLFMSAIACMFLVRGCEQRMGDGPPDCPHILRHIGMALLCYHDRYGAFPPAVVRDEAGRAMHSWRVLILPFVEEEYLYRQYDFSQPWDSPHNRKLLETTPRIFRCSQIATRSPGQTPFLAVVEPSGSWSIERVGVPARSALVPLVLEVPSKAVAWTEPVDLVCTADGLAGQTALNCVFGDSAVYSIQAENLLGSDGTLVQAVDASRLEPAAFHNR
jgi:hypothetical protein